MLKRILLFATFAAVASGQTQLQLKVHAGRGLDQRVTTYFPGTTQTK